MNKINAVWHKANKMPSNATFEQRLLWHIEHQKKCRCREGFPVKLAQEAKIKGIILPSISKK